MENHFASLKIYEAIGDKKGLADSYNNVGSVYLKQGKVAEAKNQLGLGLSIALEIGAKDKIKEAYETLSLCDSTAGNWKGAYEYHKLYKAINDSIFNDESSEKTAKMAAIYESDKKDAAIKLLNVEKEKEAAITAAESKKQRIVIYAISGGLLLLLLFASAIFKALQNNRKKNKIITHQKLLVEEKQKEITDSITYAKRIQKALLPLHSEILSELPQSFVLYKPKDIVSGDFYWFYKNNESVLIASADCTGHGVPGAFTSMICSEKLSDAVKQSFVPGKILSIVNKGIKHSLRQEENTESTKDGMDIALCSVDMKNGIINYAGANRPIWIIRTGNREIEEIKPTKQAIGGFTTDEQIFETHNLRLQQGDTFYICTDGYADQFSAKTGKKLMTKKLKEILLGIQDKSMKEQGQHLDDFMETWRAGAEQVDDILVIGVRI